MKHIQTFMSEFNSDSSKEFDSNTLDIISDLIKYNNINNFSFRIEKKLLQLPCLFMISFTSVKQFGLFPGEKPKYAKLFDRKTILKDIPNVITDLYGNSQEYIIHSILCYSGAESATSGHYTLYVRGYNKNEIIWNFYNNQSRKRTTFSDSIHINKNDENNQNIEIVDKFINAVKRTLVCAFYIRKDIFDHYCTMNSLIRK
jgi:hypothetical protein